MIDIKEIRENPQQFKDACKAKGFDVDIKGLLKADEALRKLKKLLQDTATYKNQIGKEIPKLSGDEKQAKLEQLTNYKRDEVVWKEDVKRNQLEFDELMLQVS